MMRFMWVVQTESLQIKGSVSHFEDMLAGLRGEHLSKGVVQVNAVFKITDTHQRTLRIEKKR
jgi:hypothetical protein